MSLFKDFFRVKLPDRDYRIKPGIYHFRREAGGKVTRFHLRVEEDGSGILLANAAVAARLSPTGVLIAKLRLEGVAYPMVSQTIKENFYGASERQIESDVRKITQIIGEMANLEDNYPVFNLDDPSIVPPRHLLAPFHAQMSVAPSDKINPLLEKLWNSGIMHVTFVTEANSLPSEAIQNVEWAEDLGMISGVRVPANWFLQNDFFKTLTTAGVDYIILPAISLDAAKQDTFFGEGNFKHLTQTLQECKGWEVTPVVEIPIFKENMHQLETLVNEFSAKGVKNVFYYAIANDHQPLGLSGTEIIQAAALVEQIAHRSDVRYIWLPAISTPGELKVRLYQGPRTAGDVSIRVNPDGTVYPPRGPFISAGNLNHESWQNIWKKEVFRRYRERVESPTRCEICPELEVCGADCPGDPNGWANGDPL
jgi:radical SAM protein with 4Fe4S-binding SPASM domain